MPNPESPTRTPYAHRAFVPLVNEAEIRAAANSFAYSDWSGYAEHRDDALSRFTAIHGDYPRVVGIFLGALTARARADRRAAGIKDSFPSHSRR